MNTKYPGIRTTADGAAAVVWVDTNITEAGCAYPITPSTTMGTGYQLEVANGKKNLWGTPLGFFEPESEHSAASACEGIGLAGGRVTNFTSGQGLMLMKEVLYTISGKRLPIVFHIGARAMTSHALNIHAGHDDVMGVSDTGWGMLFAKNVQEACDLALISRRAAEDSAIPYLNIQDGFLTTHTIESLLFPETEMMKEYIGDPRAKLVNLMDPAHPVMSGVVQNQDSYMKGKIAQRFYYDRAAERLQNAMNEFTRLTGRRYGMVESYRLDDAEYAIVGMGTLIETAFAAIDHMRDKLGVRIGGLNVVSFRPFPGNAIVRALKHLKAFTVLERMDNPPAQSNPLTAEIKAAFIDAQTRHPGYDAIDRVPVISSGVGGLGSRDIRPGDFLAITENMRKPGKRFFTVGIDHPLNIKADHEPDVRPAGSFALRGHSVGGYGSVTTNKVLASIVSDMFNLCVQAYPKYGSEKKGLPTTFYLSIAKSPIRTHCELEHVDFVAVLDRYAFRNQNPLAGLADGGAVFIQTENIEPADVWLDLPRKAREAILAKKIRVLTLDVVKIAREVTSVPDLIQRMQGIVLLGVFLRHTPFQKEMHLSEEQLFQGVEKSIRKYFGKRGEAVVRDNMTCVRRGYAEVRDIPREAMAPPASGKLVTAGKE